MGGCGRGGVGAGGRDARRGKERRGGGVGEKREEGSRGWDSQSLLGSESERERVREKREARAGRHWACVQIVMSKSISRLSCWYSPVWESARAWASERARERERERECERGSERSEREKRKERREKKGYHNYAVLYKKNKTGKCNLFFFIIIQSVR